MKIYQTSNADANKSQDRFGHASKSRHRRGNSKALFVKQCDVSGEFRRSIFGVTFIVEKIFRMFETLKNFFQREDKIV